MAMAFKICLGLRRFKLKSVRLGYYGCPRICRGAKGGAACVKQLQTIEVRRGRQELMKLYWHRIQAGKWPRRTVVGTTPGRYHGSGE